MRLSARNQLEGTIKTVEHGQVTTVVVLALPGGGEVVASITRDAATQLGLEPGKKASAVIKASNVMIATD
ncbi:MAG: TOBE domain-containing protein [Myxococcota bacterium]|nr:TOBE domain-containing protein [Myxococcota bacterium]